MWRAEYKPQCDITNLAGSPMLGQSTYVEDVNLCITSSLKADGLLRRPKLLIRAGPIVNPPQLLATPPVELTMPRRRRVAARSDQESSTERKVFITLEPTLDGLPSNDDGAPRPMVSTAAQEFLKHPSKAHDVDPRLLYWCSVDPKISIMGSSHASIRV
jgi:hypothetical protein